MFIVLTLIASRQPVTVNPIHIVSMTNQKTATRQDCVEIICTGGVRYNILETQERIRELTSKAFL